MSAPKRNASGGKSANVVYKNGSALVFQTPKMPAPFGISTFQPFDGKPGPAKTSLDLSFRYKDTNPEVAGFYDKMKEIDDAIIKSMITKSTEWFGEAYDDGFLRRLYKGPITPSKKAEFADTLRLKVPERKGELLVEIYGQDREKINPRDIEKGDSIIAIISPTQVYLAGNNMGTSFKITQGMRFPSTRLKGCAINFEPSAAEPAATPTKPPADTPPTKTEMREETEDDDTDMDEEAENPSE